MARIKMTDIEFTVDEIVYEGKNDIAVYVCDGELCIDDNQTTERTDDTPENREKFIHEATQIEAQRETA